jgi:hypothetical protein
MKAKRKNNIESDIFILETRCRKNYRQRAGIADGGEFYIRPPGTAAWLFDKDKY